MARMGRKFRWDFLHRILGDERRALVRNPVPSAVAAARSIRDKGWFDLHLPQAASR